MGKFNPLKAPSAPKIEIPPPVELPVYTPPPAPEPIPTAPVTDDEELRKRQKKALATQQQKSGRASTFLSDSEGLLG